MMRCKIAAAVVAIAFSATSALSQGLIEIEATLKPHLQGHWETRAKTNPPIGPMLAFNPDGTNRWRGFIGIVPFPQDDTGRQRIEFYMSTCAAPMYMLGHTTNCTVITSMARTSSVCRTVVTVLSLTVPSQQTESDKWINEGILPTRKRNAEQSVGPQPRAPQTGHSERAP